MPFKNTSGGDACTLTNGACPEIWLAKCLSKRVCIKVSTCKSAEIHLKTIKATFDQLWSMGRKNKQKQIMFDWDSFYSCKRL